MNDLQPAEERKQLRCIPFCISEDHLRRVVKHEFKHDSLDANPLAPGFLLYPGGGALPFTSANEDSG